MSGLHFFLVIDVLILTIYDIENDRIRTKVSEACKDYGLQRIQYSAFLGDLNRGRRDELLLRLRKTLYEQDTQHDRR